MKEFKNTDFKILNTTVLNNNKKITNQEFIFLIFICVVFNEYFGPFHSNHVIPRPSSLEASFLRLNPFRFDWIHLSNHQPPVNIFWLSNLIWDIYSSKKYMQFIVNYQFSIMNDLKLPVYIELAQKASVKNGVPEEGIWSVYQLLFTEDDTELGSL